MGHLQIYRNGNDPSTRSLGKKDVCDGSNPGSTFELNHLANDYLKLQTLIW